jgi:hypothetical protein
MYDPREYLQHSPYKTLLEMADHWSDQFNLNTEFSRRTGFSFHTRDGFANIKWMAARMDADGAPGVTSGLFDPEVLDDLRFRGCVVIVEGKVRFAPGMLMDACLTMGANNNFNIIRKLQDEDEKELAMSNNAQNQVGGVWEKTTEPELDLTKLAERSRFVLRDDLVVLENDSQGCNPCFPASDVKTLGGLQGMCTHLARKNWVTPWHLVDLFSIHRAMVDPSHDPNDVASF